MHIFHKWGRWEQYKWAGTVVYSGLMIPQDMRGKSIPHEERRQRRVCEICGKMQEEVIGD
jgi:hypothetical protein